MDRIANPDAHDSTHVPTHVPMLSPKEEAASMNRTAKPHTDPQVNAPTNLPATPEPHHAPSPTPDRQPPNRGTDPRRRRAWRPLAAAAVLAALAVVPPLLGGAAPRLPKPGPGMFSGSADSVVVYGPTRFTKIGSSSTWMYFEDLEFTADTVPGQRYVIEIVNGSPRVTNATVAVNGVEYVGSSECGTSVASLVRVTDATLGTNPFAVGVKGSSGSWISLRIVRVKDPTFKIYPLGTDSLYREFIRPAVIDTQTDTFSVDAAIAKSPYTLRIVNGGPNGANRVTSGTVSINGSVEVQSGSFGSGIATITRNPGLEAHDTLAVLNQSAAGTRLYAGIRATDESPPVLAITSPAANPFYTTAAGVRVSGTVADEIAGLVSLNGRPAQWTPGAFSDSVSFAGDGRYWMKVEATNSARLSRYDSVLVVRDTTDPFIEFISPAADTLVAAETTTLTVGWADTSETAASLNGDTLGIAPYGNAQRVVALDMGQNRILLRAVDAMGRVEELTRYVFRVAPDEPEPVDSTVAGSVATTAGVRSFLEQVQFLYTDPEPLQTQVVADSIHALLAAVVRGKVIGRDYTGLPSVTVSVAGHPEFGSTRTREDGWFDLVVNGGAPLTLKFQKPGFLESQRQVETFPNDYAIVDEVAMVGKSAVANWVDLDAGQVVRGRFASDANGDRDLRVFFRPGTVARVVGAGTDTTDFTEVRLRITEYTIGADGPQAMPAQLPPSSAYTYCFNLTLDEADAIATAAGLPSGHTLFNQPYSCYVRNFLHFPVGMRIPFGFYYTDAGTWLPDSDGVVIKLLSTSGDTLYIDSDGDAAPDSALQLAILGIDHLELQQIAGQFAIGDTIWRSRAAHFSESGDLNPKGPKPNPLKFGNGQVVATAYKTSDPDCQTGSIIECETCVLGQSIPIVGTPYALTYRSSRAPGDLASRTLRVPLVGDTIPGGNTLVRIVARVDVAGRRYEQVKTNPVPHDSAVFVWDGRDAYGRIVGSSVNARVSVGYQFTTRFIGGDGGRNFGEAGAWGMEAGAVADRGNGPVQWSRRTVRVGVPQPLTDALGGWTLSPHHFYDPQGRGALYRGDGSALYGDERPLVSEFLAGGTSGNTIASECVERNGVGLKAIDVAVGKDGSLYVIDAPSHSIFKLPPTSGSMCRIAGTGSNAGTFLDGDSATKTPLDNPKRLVVGPDGSVYFVMNSTTASFTRACRVTPDGIIHSIAGTGTSGTGAGDGGPATAATLKQPTSIALGVDGSVFIGDGPDHRIRRVGPDGIITTYAGTGTPGGSAEGRATTVGIAGADGLVVDGDGNLYLSAAGGSRIQRVTPDGMMSTWLEGTGFWPWDLALGPDGAMYITHSAQTSGGRIYKRDPDGNLSVFAGGALGGPFGSYATATQLRGSGSNPLQGLAVAPDGAVYLAQGEVARIAPALAQWIGDAFVVPEADGSVMHYFDARGRHRYTRDALTGGIRHRFAHDAAGRLVAVYDANGDSTVIERDGNGVPLRIIAPYGERTELGLDGNGWLHTVTNPAGETVTLTAGGDGLLTAYRDAKQQEHTFAYHADGRLHIDDDPAGGSQTLTKSTGLNTHAVERRTGEGRATNYVVSTYYPPSGATPAVVERWTTGPDQLTTRRRFREDGFHYADDPNGVFTIDSLVPDRRYGLLAPLRAMQRIRMPSGLTQTIKTEHPTAGSAFDPPATNGTWIEKVTVNGRPPIELSINTTVSPALMTLESSAGRVFLGRVDSVGRLRTLIAPGQDSVLLSYDARGRLVRWAQGSRSLRYRYDLGDPFGRLEQVVDTLGRTVAFTYDSAGRVERQDLPGGRSVSYAYDGNGNLSTLTPPGRPAHGFLHTAVDLVEEYIPPDVGLAEERTRYGYDLDRNLETILRPDGIEVSLGYDGAGRLATVTVPEGVVDLDYDWASRLESIASADGAVTVSYGYDGDLVTSEAWTGAVAGTVGYTYDREFRVKTQSVNGGHGATYVYDDDGLPEQAGALDVTRSAATGQLLGTTLGNVTTTHSYNGYGEPLLVAARSGTDTLWRAVYGRDALGRITGISENVLGTVTVRGYAYSDTGFLSVVSANGVAVERYGYDGNGNRTRFEAPGYGVDGDHDDQDRLIEYGDTRYAYTAAGELAERVVGSDTTRYRYDALGNLLAVRFASGDSVEYLVDGRNRRVARLWNGAVTHRWLYQDQLEPVAEVDAAGSVVARYVYGTRGHVPDYVVKGDSTYRIVSDHLGSVRLVVNVASGWVAQRLDYDGYGRVTLDTNPGFQGFGYAGGLWDGATGLVRFGARDYDASMGRWTSRDPQHPGPHGYGAYLYGVADPMSFLDLDGRDIVVAYYPGTRPFGHVGIGVNTTHTRGFNPITKDLAILTGVPRPGQVLPDNPNERIDYVVIPTTTDQDKRVQELIDLREKYPGYYDLNDRSCVDMVRDILQEVGIETEQTDYPRPFFDDLKERFPPPRGPCPRKKP